MRDSFVTNRSRLRRHVFDHPGQMRDVVHVDDRIDEVAGEAVVAAATRRGTNCSCVNI